MRNNTQEDIALTEVSSISFDHQRSRKIKRENVTETGEKEMINQQTYICFTVANRISINKILYTNEDAPPMIFIHVSPVLRPNNTMGTLYFQFEITSWKWSAITNRYLIHKRSPLLTTSAL